MGYVLATEGMRVITRNERGSITKRKKFRRGDEVTRADLEQYEGRFDALVESGALVQSLDDVETVDPSDPAFSGGAGNANATTPTEDLGNSADADEDAEGDQEDGLDGMSYTDLQKVAKEETGDGSGSKADLIERIRDHRSE